MAAPTGHLSSSGKALRSFAGRLFDRHFAPVFSHFLVHPVPQADPTIVVALPHAAWGSGPLALAGCTGIGR
jgi:hypothetical protein